MKIIASSITGLGSRKINQDACDIALCPKGGCMAVCDGLGSYDDSGKIANVCVMSFTNAFLSLVSRQTSDLISADSARHCVSVAKNNVYFKRIAVSSAGSSTTLGGLLLNGNKAVIVNVGDTRIYRITDGKITYVTQDHSLAGNEVLKDKISRYEIASHPKQNVLTKTIGTNFGAEADITVFTDVTERDKFLICTDGFWTAISEPEMEEIAKRDQAPSFALSQFEKFILGQKTTSQDNYSAILCGFIK